MSTDLRCIRCGALYGASRDYFGCPACGPNVPSNLELDTPLSLAQTETGRGMWRFAEALPVELDQAVSLGEGGTPLLDLPRIGEAIGLPRLLAKNEAQNPTWSFKDRLASAAVSWARVHGRRGIAVSSSGNAGAAAAAYAARAGMPCIIFTTRAFPGSMQRFMRSYGAMVVTVPTGPDRWRLNRAVAAEWGWLPLSNVADPPVGSHPAGIEGYKTIAFEIAQDLAWEAPEAVILPVAYGDAMAGIYRGFRELLAAGSIDRLPRLIAAETYPSLSRALAEGA
ncbi:MAG: pyridoxal-phosphate dependent enzyme, partial [Chloroflexota bacterium]